ncbi:7,8-dihydro-6-hydroxymethylpterin dimethyltransferase [uncultured archaeon]|nr:7,8-dihydro-6-hydroxymethylpterin dimethyltransferase [uncultured archaeon]
MTLLKMTRSICPKCNKVIDASVVEEDGKVWLQKKCDVHGSFKELYWGDANMYKWVEGFASEGAGVSNPAISIDPSKVACPYNCGLCTAHKSHTALANVFVTNRCNKRCWYCFAGLDNIKKNGYVYEPPFEQIVEMLRVLRDERPVPTNAIQFTGGEPTIRDDMLDIIKEAVKMGFQSIMLNTNGITLALDPDLVARYRKAGVNFLYLSFDGVTATTNPKNHEYIPKIIENCRKAGMPVTLVPTLINGVNDHEIWPIVRFGLDNIDVVRSVNFQPVSFVGTMTRSISEEEKRKAQRITIPDMAHKLEAQSKGLIRASGFYPVPTVAPVADIISKVRGGMPITKFTCNSHCGMATFVFKDGDKIIPLEEFVDIGRAYKLLKELSFEDLGTNVGKLKAATKLYSKVSKIVNKEKAPKDVDVASMIVDVLLKKGGTDKFVLRSMMIGSMHFMDPYNYDIDRVQRCVIHYVTPDGRIIPFCAFNVLPEFYRDKINKKFGIPIAEWEKQTGKKLEDDLKRI